MRASPAAALRALALVLLATPWTGCAASLGAPPAAGPPPVVAEAPAASRSPARPPRERRYLGFDAAKRALARDVHGDHRTDVYCACSFDEALRVDPACGYEPRSNPARGARIEWEHLMPASRFGKPLACWRGETPGCRARGLRGRTCCARSPERGGDPYFRRMEGDLHNLAPAVGELNADRSDRPFGLVAGEPRRYGGCDFEVDFEAGSAGPAEPPPRVWGDVARAWLYMSDEHQIPLTPDERHLLQAWHASDPPDAWELVRDERIALLQGNSNRWVSSTPHGDPPGPSSP